MFVFNLPYPSPGGPGAEKREGQELAWTSVLVPFFDRVFWTRFGTLLGSIWASLLGLLGAQVGPSWLQDTFGNTFFSQDVILQN